ncbi:MAG: response regulator [Candidatus Riflebacteria bacterium]|nr:response regulator [Candidatus Riflebacteria bacterium]
MPDLPLERILYVEDEPDIRMVAQMALEAVGGFTVQVCGSGAEALRTVESFGPQLIILDVMMPEMDGPTTLGELRKRPCCATTPILFMTAKVQPAEVARFLSLGAIDVIAKPFDPMTLADTVRGVWSRFNG